MGVVPAVASVVSLQSGAAVAAGMFDVVEPSAVLLVRQGVPALVLALATRVWRHLSLTKQQRRAVVQFGVSMSVMSLAMYQAIDRLPLGTAVTIEMLGPIGLSVVLVRHRRQFACAGLALVGVAVLHASTLGPASSTGVLFALGAAFGWSRYIANAERVADCFDDLTGLCLALFVASLCTLPFAIVAGLGSLLTPANAGRAIAVAMLSALVPFTLDQRSVRLARASTFAILQVLSPVVAATLGAVLLDQPLSVSQVVGMACVIVAAVGAVHTPGTVAASVAGASATDDRSSPTSGVTPTEIPPR